MVGTGRMGPRLGVLLRADWRRRSRSGRRAVRWTSIRHADRRPPCAHRPRRWRAGLRAAAFERYAGQGGERRSRRSERPIARAIVAALLRARGTLALPAAGQIRVRQHRHGRATRTYGGAARRVGARPAGCASRSTSAWRSSPRQPPGGWPAKASRRCIAAIDGRLAAIGRRRRVRSKCSTPRAIDAATGIGSEGGDGRRRPPAHGRGHRAPARHRRGGGRGKEPPGKGSMRIARLRANAIGSGRFAKVGDGNQRRPGAGRGRAMGLARSAPAPTSFAVEPADVWCWMSDNPPQGAPVTANAVARHNHAQNIAQNLFWAFGPPNTALIPLCGGRAACTRLRAAAVAGVRRSAPDGAV